MPSDWPKDLDKSQLERKIRLLTLATLAFQNVGRDVPYSVLSKALQVEQSDVERWVIDGTCNSYSDRRLDIDMRIRKPFVLGLSQENCLRRHKLSMSYGLLRECLSASNGRFSRSGSLHGRQVWQMYWRLSPLQRRGMAKMRR